MADMNRNQQQGGNRRSEQSLDRHRDLQSGRDQQSRRQQQEWDGNDRRTHADRRISHGNMEMNEGSSR